MEDVPVMFGIDCLLSLIVRDFQLDNLLVNQLIKDYGTFFPTWNTKYIC